MTRKEILTTLIFLLLVCGVKAQDIQGQIDTEGNISRNTSFNNSGDSAQNHKEIPKGIKVWTVDSRYGDIIKAQPDTLSYLFMNTIFTSGLQGEYNTTGNLGAPRINRIFMDRENDDAFLFTIPYNFIIQPLNRFLYTNTLSPKTNLSYNTAGNRNDGEDHFKANFAVNAGKKLGFGFIFDYLYGRGFYQSQSTSHLQYAMYGSYLGDRYQAHLLFKTNHQKVAENGGITNDNYILHPEIFNEDYQAAEIPTQLTRNWNRNKSWQVFFTHRYNIGFTRKVPMTPEEIKAKKFALEAQKEKKMAANAEKKGINTPVDPSITAGRPDGSRIVQGEPTLKDSTTARITVTDKAMADSLIAAEKKAKEKDLWMKNEYVPVTSFIHTATVENYERIYQAYQTPQNYYQNTYLTTGRWVGDSIFDQTTFLKVKNTFAISLLEGFNKWAKAGIKVFATSELNRYQLPNEQGLSTNYLQHHISVGGQLVKKMGKTLHYDANVETWIAGQYAGQLKVDGNIDLNFKLFGDTVKLEASGFLYRNKPNFYYQHYHGKHLWWDNTDLNFILHTRIAGMLSYPKTQTSLRVAVDEIKNHTYFAQSYDMDDEQKMINHRVGVQQESGGISILSAALDQKFKLGPIHWHTVATLQKSSNEQALPLPLLNVYSNLFFRFKIAKVLDCDLGADVRYFTQYRVPDYMPALGSYVNQTGNHIVELGNYPIVNVYANFKLKYTRFFVMAEHINEGLGKLNYFQVPHYPLNQRLIRFGLSWDFFN